MGKLVLAGGNVYGNEVYEEFLRLAGGEDALLGVICTASIEPLETFDRFRSRMMGLGLDHDRVVFIPIGESLKYTDGDKVDLNLFNDLTGVWFSGGDQVKITNAFLKSDGSDTLALSCIRDLLAEGAVVGGTSAGCAIMSNVMIGGGSSFGALTNPIHDDVILYRGNPLFENRGDLLLMNGLNFFTFGIVDQHFAERGRYGRLVESMYSKNTTYGFGVSENTALVVDVDTATSYCVGSGGVTIMDLNETIKVRSNGYSSYEGIKMSFMTDGDTYDFNSNEFSTNKNKINISNDADPLSVVAGGYFSNYSPLNQFICNTLCESPDERLLHDIDKDMYYVKTYLNGDELSYEIRFYRNYLTHGYYHNHYSFENVIVDLLPIQLKVEYL